MTTPAQRTLWIGTYPAEGASAGSGEGIWRVDVDADGRFGEPRLVVTSPSPSFVALHPSGRTLYAVAEDAPGAVSAFPVSDDGALGDPVTLASGGTFPCHLLALTDALWVANYGDGVAAVAALDPDTGAFAVDAVARFEGSGTGPQEDRQEGPHAHFTAAAGDLALVVDLGADVIRRYPAGPPAADAPETDHVVAAALPAGTGPRHLVTLPDGALVVAGELDARLHVLTPAGPGSWEHAASTPATTVEARDPEQRAAPSHVALSGDLLTLGVRGADVLSVHRAVPGEAGVPTLEPLADVPLGAGALPRHHAVLGETADGRRLVVVARQGTGDLAAVLVDPVTGEGEVVDALPLPTPPACVLEAS
ncbi:lactonase family protein [Xylanimonas sp. McL0601]|uniref:lactonase family protein n=1 Tax=Xylanimonas sp. McL0601 TaxID=3414739 RepID=UPI003CFAABE7